MDYQAQETFRAVGAPDCSGGGTKTVGEFPDRSLLRQALQDIDRIQDIIPGDVPVGHHADS